MLVLVVRRSDEDQDLHIIHWQVGMKTGTHTGAFRIRLDTPVVDIFCFRRWTTFHKGEWKPENTQKVVLASNFCSEGKKKCHFLFCILLLLLLLLFILTVSKFKHCKPLTTYWTKIDHGLKCFILLNKILNKLWYNGCIVLLPRWNMIFRWYTYLICEVPNTWARYAGSSCRLTYSRGELIDLLGP